MGRAMMAIFLLLLAAPLGAEVQVVSREELAGRLKYGQKIKLVLKSGTYAEGRWEEIGPATLKVNVSKTDDAREIATGVQEVSLDRVASISQLVRKGGKRWKLPLALCSTLGTFALLAAGGTEERAGDYLPAAAAFTSAIGVGGYFAGKAMDERWMTYVLRAPEL